ncbi:TPA: ERF family protein [Streptococcus suis]|nr:ERF family protein [Streptococcus suis]
MRKSETIIELSKAFAKMQMELEQPLKNADNPFFKSKYVPLENVVDSITRAANNDLCLYLS